MLRPTLYLTVLLFITQSALAQSPERLSDVVMATVRLSNPKSSATGFILLRPKANDDQPLRSALITAAHVFEKAEGDEITVGFRRKEADGSFSKMPIALKVRNAGKPLWTKHPKLDVAAIEIESPQGTEPPRLTFDQLATADDVRNVEPGEIVNCMTYPHAPVFEPNPPGFPIVRMGCIASFPLSTAWSMGGADEKQATFLVDYNSFEGDSGGPVVWKTIDSSSGKPAIKILGLVQGQHLFNQRYELPYESGEFRKPLGLGIVLNAQAVRETIRQLP
jgi:hypothetical protein